MHCYFTRHWHGRNSSRWWWRRWLAVRIRFFYENDHHTINSSVKTTQALNDSKTHLKETAAIENGASDCSIDIDKGSKSCETCNVNSRSKKQYGMIDCSLYIVWYHEQCVVIQKDEPFGIWLCTSYRKVPHTGWHNKHKKWCKTTITVYWVNTYGCAETDYKLDSCVGNINDRLTASSIQISCNDRTMTESIETWNASTNRLKANFDQKTCQRSNKTTAVPEKVKSDTDSVKTIILQSQSVSGSERTQSVPNTLDQSAALKRKKVINLFNPQNMPWKRKDK